MKQNRIARALVALAAVLGLALVAVSVMLGVCGFLLSTLAVVYGVTHMPVQRSAVIMLFELIVGAASAWWLAGEVVTLREWIGGILILSAALIAIVQEEKAK